MFEHHKSKIKIQTENPKRDHKATVHDAVTEGGLQYLRFVCFMMIDLSYHQKHMDCYPRDQMWVIEHACLHILQPSWCESD